MPEIVAVVASAFSFVSGSAALLTIEMGAPVWFATTVSYLTQAAMFFSVSRAITPKAKMSSVRSTGTQIMVQGTAESHRIIYGQNQVSGIFYPLGASGSSNEYLHFLIIYASHECQDLGTLSIAGEAVTVDGSGNVTSGKYAGLIRVLSHLGAWDQTVDTQLQSELGSSFWPNTAKLQGRAYDYVRIKYDQNISAAGVPAMTRLIKGRKVYDPRDGTQSASDPTTWKWSNNAALCVADWVAGVQMKNGAGNVITPYGFKASWSEFNTADLIEAANICDESIALAAGGTELRYTCNGIIQTSATRGDVLDALRSSMLGDVVYVGGLWSIRAGAYRTPTVTITEDDFRGPIANLQVKPSRKDVVNGVKGTYVSPDNNWQASDYPAYTKRINATSLAAGDRVQIVTLGTTNFTSIGAASNAVGVTFTATGPGTGTGTVEQYIVEDGGERIWHDLEFPFTTSESTAQRISKIILERARQPISFVAKLKLTALQIQTTDVVMVTFPRYGWAAKPFRVEQFTLAVDTDSQGHPVLGCDLMLRETESALYDWNTEEKAVDPAPNTTLPNPFTVAAPTGLSLAATSFRQADSQSLTPQLQVSWTTPADQYVKSGGRIRVQFKKHNDANWTDWSLIKGDQSFDYILGLVLGTAYDVQIRAENQVGAVSAWVQSLNFTMTADTTPPAAPTGLAASTGTGKLVSLSWTANTEGDLAALNTYAIYRNTSNTTVGATLIGRANATSFRDINVALGTPYWYFLTAFDQSGNESSKSSGATATPSGVATGASVTDPTAASNTGSGFYLAGDGTVLSYLQFSLPGLPSNSVGQYLLYRRNGDSQWLIAGDYSNAATLTGIRIPDLTPGVAYEVASEAYNSFGDASNVISATSSPFTAPVKNTAPTTPTGGTISGDGVKPKFFPGTQVFLFGTRVGWDKNTDVDFAYFEVKGTYTNSDAATDYSWTPNDGANYFVKTTESETFLYNGFLNPGYVRIRAVNRSGVASPWVALGNANASASIGTGSVAAYDRSGVIVTGISTGAGASTTKKAVVYSDSAVVLLSGGSPTEVINIDISNRGFSAKPDNGWIECASDGNIVGRYNFDHSSNSSSNAVFEVRTIDGTNISYGLYRFSIELNDYT